VVITGHDVDFPHKVYFLEAALIGDYVKYSSNANFDLTDDQNGMDPIIFGLMNAFTHWTYQDSLGKQLVCDLQGVGPIITEPQIIHVDSS
jgi:hypothetical protein